MINKSYKMIEIIVKSSMMNKEDAVVTDNVKNEQNQPVHNVYRR